MPRLLLLLALLALAPAARAEADPWSPCAELARAPAAFGLHLLKLVAPHYDYHFVFSHQSVWRALAAAAEAADEPARAELLAVLRLPALSASREQHYACAAPAAWEPPAAADRAAPRRRLLLALDDSLTVNETWVARVRAAGLLNVTRAPLHADPRRARDRLGDAVVTPLDDIDISGDAVFLDTLEYGVAWSLDGDSIEREAPFYDDAGRRVGAVDLMRVRTPARVVTELHLNATLAEVPLDEQYSLLVVMAREGSTLRDVVGALSWPLGGSSTLWSGARRARVKLPRFALTVQHDNVRALLELAGVRRLWCGAGATRGLSVPPATPSAYMQRVSLRLDAELDDAIDAAVADDDDEPEVLVVNKPFFYCLFDHESRDCHFYGAYSEPVPYPTSNDVDA